MKSATGNRRNDRQKRIGTSRRGIPCLLEYGHGGLPARRLIPGVQYHRLGSQNAGPEWSGYVLHSPVILAGM
jgi:hypothetical protein